jgi:ABC-2 type transport system permease protein
MSTAALLDAPTVAPQRAGPRSRLSDVWVMARRNLAHVAREPMQLSDATVQPVLFTLLFVYVFGGSMVLPGGGDYKQFAIGGLLAMNLTTSSVGTAVGLTTDLSTGVLDRRSGIQSMLPARSALSRRKQCEHDEHTNVVRSDRT